MENGRRTLSPLYTGPLTHLMLLYEAAALRLAEQPPATAVLPHTRRQRRIKGLQLRLLLAELKLEKAVDLYQRHLAVTQLWDMLLTDKFDFPRLPKTELAKTAHYLKASYKGPDLKEVHRLRAMMAGLQAELDYWQQLP